MEILTSGHRLARFQLFRPKYFVLYFVLILRCANHEVPKTGVQGWCSQPCRLAIASGLSGASPKAAMFCHGLLHAYCRDTRYITPASTLSHDSLLAHVDPRSTNLPDFGECSSKLPQSLPSAILSPPLSLLAVSLLLACDADTPQSTRAEK